MSFEEYIDNIKKKTGSTPEAFKEGMEADGTFSPQMKASILCRWLAEHYQLGHGHVMAIWKYFKAKGWIV